MKKLLALLSLSLAAALRAVNPVPYAEGVTISFRISGLGDGIMTVYGEGTASLSHTTYNTTSESGIATAWLRPGKKYSVNFQASGPSEYWLSYIAPAGYLLLIDNQSSDLTYRNTGGGWYSHDYTVELQPIGESGRAEAGAFGGIKLGQSVTWDIGLGGLRTGRSAGRIWFKEYDLTGSPANRARLYYAPPGNISQITVVKDGPSGQTLRQVMVPQALADLTDLTGDPNAGYQIAFYTPAQATWNGASYNLSGTPWKTIKVEPTGTTQVKVTETEGSVVRVSQLTAPSVSGGNYTWTLLEGGPSGNWLRTTTHTSTLTIVSPATGGTVTTSGGYTIHTFTGSGTFTANQGLTVEALVVAGGGGGGGGLISTMNGGGGGGGGVLYSSALGLTAGSYAVTVGAGGNSGTNGGNSSFASLTAVGGGHGAHSAYAAPGASGGSGGGEGTSQGGGAGAGTSGQGNAGAAGAGGPNYEGGGGGGSLYAGGGYYGGWGAEYSISGTATRYGGGGGGGTNASTGGPGGLGGGGNGGGASGAQGANGVANTGGGGGGSAQWSSTGGAGGSGIVIVRYAATGASYRDVVVEVRTGGASGTLVSKTKYRYENPGGWGEEVTQVTANPDGGSNALTTTYTYYTDSGARGNYRKTRSVTSPTGQWAAWSYYDDWDRRGRLQYEFHPFLDSPGSVSLSTSSGRVVSYDYAASWTGRKQIPSSVVETVNGVTTARTVTTPTLNQVLNGQTYTIYQADAYSASAAYVRSITQVIDPGGAASNPDYYGLPYAAQRPDQTQSSFFHHYGSYNYSTKAFTYPGDISHFRTIELKGSTNSSGAEAYNYYDSLYAVTVYLVPSKSTKDVVIRNSAGLPVRTETHVYTGSGAFALLTSEDLTYDAQGRLTSRVASNGATTTFTYANGLLTSTTGVDGTETQFTYDALWRVATTGKKGASALASTLTSGYSYPAQGDITTTHTYDGADRVTQSVTSGGSLSLVNSAAFDLAGRPASQTVPGGYTTTFAYANGGRTVTATLPGGSTKTTDTFLDGRTRSVTGTAVVHEHFTHNIQGDGTHERIHRQVSAAGPAVAYLYTDWLGRKIIHQVPSPSGSGYTDDRWHYNSSGQLWKATRLGVNPTLYVYDTLGALVRSGLDVNNNGSLDLASTDRITDLVSTFFTTGGNWWRRETASTYATDNSSTATQTAKVETQLSGLPTNRLSRTDRTGIFGNVTSSYTDVERSNKRVVTTTDHPDSTTNTVAVSHNGLAVETQDFAGIKFRTEYDALGRPWKTIDPRTGTTTTAYVSGTSLVSTITDPANALTTTYTYDSAGRVSSVKDALNKYAYTSYTTRGEIFRQWGDTTYPVEYAYDDQGRKLTMKTYRGGSGWNASTWPSSPGTADTTTWAYHAPTGLLTAKTDAAGRTVSHTYTQVGQPYQRTWARGVVTTYAYSSATGELTSITYSDGTPSVSFTYNRLGQTSTVVDVTGTRTLTYNLAGTLELQNEILPSGYFGDRRVTRGYDTTTSGALGRYNRLGVGPSGAPYSEIDQPYGFDASGRLNSIGYTAHTYTYTTNSHLIASIAHTSSGWAQTRTYLSSADIVDVMETKFGATTKAKFDYTHDSLYRVITSAKTGEMFNTYGNGTQGLETDYAYDDKSQLMADSTTLGGSPTPLSGRDDYHAYDPIGNRTSVNRSGTTLTFTSNNLNQYVSFTGSATHTYDLDGNLTNDGIWSYTWNAENKLVAQETLSGVIPQRRLEFAYDYLGRRVRKIVKDWGGGAWITSTDLKIIYDGHNALLELNALNSLAKVRAHIWGLDLSNTLHGAGGVGGLLYTHDYTTSTTYMPAYDGNGNILNYVNASTGAITQKYEYDAFGQTIVSAGSAAAATPFRFATKYTDTETGLVNFGYRYYSPSLGRFLNRDPISESGGLNLYAYVLNNPANRWDYLGMNPDEDPGIAIERQRRREQWQDVRRAGYILSGTILGGGAITVVVAGGPPAWAATANVGSRVLLSSTALRVGYSYVTAKAAIEAPIFIKAAAIVSSAGAAATYYINGGKFADYVPKEYGSGIPNFFAQVTYQTLRFGTHLGNNAASYIDDPFSSLSQSTLAHHTLGRIPLPSLVPPTVAQSAAPTVSVPDDPPVIMDPFVVNGTRLPDIPGTNPTNPSFDGSGSISGGATPGFRGDGVVARAIASAWVNLGPLSDDARINYASWRRETAYRDLARAIAIDIATAGSDNPSDFASLAKAAYGRLIMEQDAMALSREVKSKYHP